MRFKVKIITDLEFEQVFEAINAWRKEIQLNPLKKSSVKQYCGNYNILSTLCKAQNDDDKYFLEDYENISKALLQPNGNTGKVLTENSRRNYLNSVIVMSQTLGLDGDTIQKFVDDRDELNVKYTKAKKEDIFNDAEKDCKITEKDIDEMLKKLDKRITSLDIWKADMNNITEKDFELVQFFVMMMLYKHHRLRNDFSSLHIITLKKYKLLEFNKVNNYLLIKGREIEIILNDFKTNKNENQEIIRITNKHLKTILKRYIKIIGNDNPLFSRDGETPLTTNQLTVFLQKNNMEHLGYKLSTRLLRKIFYTEKYGDVADTLKNDAAANLHSTGTAMNIYCQGKSVEGDDKVPLSDD